MSIANAPHVVWKEHTNPTRHGGVHLGITPYHIIMQHGPAPKKLVGCMVMSTTPCIMAQHRMAIFQAKKASNGHIPHGSVHCREGTHRSHPA